MFIKTKITACINENVHGIFVLLWLPHCKSMRIHICSSWYQVGKMISLYRGMSLSVCLCVSGVLSFGLWIYSVDFDEIWLYSVHTLTLWNGFICAPYRSNMNLLYLLAD